MASWNEEADGGSGGETDGVLDDLLCDAQDSWFGGDYEQAITASTSAIQHIQRASSASASASSKKDIRTLFEAHEIRSLALKALGTSKKSEALEAVMEWFEVFTSEEIRCLNELSSGRIQRLLKLVVEVAFLNSQLDTLTSTTEMLSNLFEQQQEEEGQDHYESERSLLWDYLHANLFLVQLISSQAPPSSSSSSSSSSSISQPFFIDNNTRAKQKSPTFVKLFTSWRSLKSSSSSPSSEEENWRALEQLVASETSAQEKTISPLGGLGCLLLTRLSLEERREKKPEVESLLRLTQGLITDSRPLTPSLALLHPETHSSDHPLTLFPILASTASTQ